MYRIILRSVGNPHFGQDPYQAMSPTEEIMVDTLQQAAEAARAYIERHNLGGGNFPSPCVFKGNQVVARISYNGRIWLSPEGGWDDNDPNDWRRWREAPG